MAGKHPEDEVKLSIATSTVKRDFIFFISHDSFSLLIGVARRPNDTD
jgi:hypothetical protein